MTAQSPILFVTDEPGAAEHLQPQLQEAVGEREVRLISDEEAALDCIELEKIDTVFCRMRSGVLSSTLFLGEVWKRNSTSSRFVIDAFIDPESMMRCVLGAHQSLETPLNPAVVRASLERAEAIKNFVQNERMQSLVSKMRVLPTKPTVYFDVKRELRAPGANPKDVAEIVAKDLGIATKLLQLVNSPYFGRSGPVSDLTEAISVLGLETTSSIVLSVEVMSRFDRVKPIYFSVDKVWKHSQAIAALVEKICQMAQVDRETSGLAYLAALLHDIGKLALAQNFDEEYHNVSAQAEKQGRPVSEIEKETYGATHADVGGYLLAVWGLPLPVVEAVAYHHESSGIFRTLSPAAAVHIAEQINASSDPVEEILERYAPELGLRPSTREIQDLVPVRPAKHRSPLSSAATSAMPETDGTSSENRAGPHSRTEKSGKQSTASRLFDRFFSHNPKP